MFCNGFGIGSYGYGNYGYGGPIMMIGFLLILLAAFYFIFKAVQNKNTNMAYEKNSPIATEILNERFARGEISEEEYRSRKNQLQK